METGLAERLRAEWHDDLSPWIASSDDIDQAFDELTRRYQEPHRRYHNLQHVASVLRFTESLAGDAIDPSAVRLAAWFHDAVYNPAAKDNEPRSAVLAAANLAALAVPAPQMRECARLIELTSGHRTAGTDPNAAVLLDADLAILASAPDRYDHYVANVREEYGHVDDATFCDGRRHLLATFLGRAYIFNTHSFRTEREARARANLTRELESLSE